MYITEEYGEVGHFCQSFIGDVDNVALILHQTKIKSNLWKKIGQVRLNIVEEYYRCSLFGNKMNKPHTN